MLLRNPLGVCNKSQIMNFPTFGKKSGRNSLAFLLLVLAWMNVSVSSAVAASPSTVFLVDWNTANDSTYTSGATLNERSVSVSTPSYGNSGNIYAGNWGQMLGSGVDIDSSYDQGY